MTATNYRLPRSISPRHYHVVLCASPKRQKFHGAVVLTVELASPSPTVELHARDLQVDRVVAHGATRQTGRVTRNVEHETVTLHFAKSLPAGQHDITLRFAGKLNANMHGLYLAEDGPERAIVSQCEATDARAIFPCFDEPAFKATLRWTLVTDPQWEVVTNGVLERSKKVRGKKEVAHYFAPTRVIPTYLAAVAIGPFQSTPVFSVQGIPCRVLGGHGKLDQTAFAKAVTQQVLPWYRQYFGQPYNYQKLDQVAVPGFDAGAMENVGAIFYRQNLLLMHPTATSWQAQKRIAEVIAHEIAHQWFGNLVTMQWWDDLWLNEAFATWIAYKACDQWHPEWRIWDDYLDSKESALNADAMVHTHPIYTPVESPAQATELFDVITYEKGCAVLRMVESFLGADVFQAGIASYIDRYKNANAAGADLWNALEAAARQPVAEMMQSWVTQSGFPLVTVTVGHQDRGTVLHISQRRFFSNAQRMQQDTADQRWALPLEIAYDLGNGMAMHHALVTEQEQVVLLPHGGKARWVYPNAHATGFFRLQMDDASQQALLTHGLRQLSPAARLSFVEDQWALVRCNLAHVDPFMDVLAAMRDESDYAVLRTITARLSYLHEVLVGEHSEAAFAAFVRHFLGRHLSEVGWDAEADESPTRAVRRAVVIDALGELGKDADVLHEAWHRVRAEMDDPSSCEPNLAGIIVALGAQTGDKQRLRQYVNIYQERKSAGMAPELQARYLRALSAFDTPQVVAQVLELSLDGTVPQEQLRVVLVPLLSRRTTQMATWRFIQKNWAQIGPRVGAMGMARLVESTGALPFAERDNISAFFTKHPVPEAERALQKALETIDLRHELVKREAPRLEEWLEAWQADGDTNAGE